MFNMLMVKKIEVESIVIVKTRYWLSKGTTSDVGGIMSNKSKKKSVNASIIEIESVIFSPEFDDKRNTRIVKKAMLADGTIRLTM
jgi:hypothetical protein